MTAEDRCHGCERVCACACGCRAHSHFRQALYRQVRRIR
jgi:hypothetical protein